MQWRSYCTAGSQLWHIILLALPTLWSRKPWLSKHTPLQPYFMCPVVALQETDEDRGRRIAAQWTSDPAAAGTAAPVRDTAAHDTTHSGDTSTSHSSTRTTSSKQTSPQTANSNAASNTHNLRNTVQTDLSDTHVIVHQQASAPDHAANAVSRWVQVLLWVVLAVACSWLGAGRMLARARRTRQARTRLPTSMKRL
eukprot:GHRR01025099.1.p2 GENE.GHRR01025099.1~~GHRR01025099.1.p2  ORF type:complete len:196 (+),score=55.14 GHRR01025099.1:243-830(+)